MQQYNSLSDEELKKLLETAKEAQDEKVIPIYNDVLAFLNYFKIESGTFPVLIRLLYKLYHKWSKEPVSKVTFGAKILDHYVDLSGYIHINKNSLQVDNEVLQYYHTQRLVDKRKSPAYRKVLERFIKEFDLKEGTTWVEPYILFYLYDKWNYERGYHKALGKDNFVKLLKLYFPYKRLTNSKLVYFKMDKDSIYKVIPRTKVKSLRKSYNEKFYKKSTKKGLVENPNANQEYEEQKAEERERKK